MYGTYCRLNVHVGASNRTVIRAARRKLAKACLQDQGALMKRARKEFYRQLLKEHADAGRLYGKVLRGAF